MADNPEGDEENKPTKVAPIPVRELPDVDIYEVPNFGNDDVNEKVKELQQALREKLKERKDVDAKYIAYNNLGTAYFRLFKFDKAELCHHQHLQLSKAVTSAIPFQDKRPANRKEEKIARVNLGCVYSAKREFELALQTFKEALVIAEELEDCASQARIYNNMGNIYEKNCDFESGIECYKSRMTQLYETGDVNGQIKCAASLGNLFILQGDIRESIMYFEKAVISIRMKIVKEQMDALEANNTEAEGGGGEGGGEKVVENAEYYDEGVA